MLKSTDIVELIIEDHKPLKELIEVMKDSEKDMVERVTAFREFIPILIAHAKPEGEILYTFMKKNKKLREGGFEGEVEHILAEQLVEEAKRTDDEDLLSARIKVFAELVEHHLKEEEKGLLPDVKRNSTSNERILLGSHFLKLKLEYLAAGDENIEPDTKYAELMH